jgi:hypothetical protein
VLSSATHELAQEGMQRLAGQRTNLRLEQGTLRSRAHLTRVIRGTVVAYGEPGVNQIPLKARRSVS